MMTTARISASDSEAFTEHTMPWTHQDQATWSARVLHQKGEESECCSYWVARIGKLPRPALGADHK